MLEFASLKPCGPLQLIFPTWFTEGSMLIKSVLCRSPADFLLKLLPGMKTLTDYNLIMGQLSSGMYCQSQLDSRELDEV